MENGNLEVDFFDDLVNSSDAPVGGVRRVGGRASGGREAGMNGGLFLGGVSGITALLKNSAAVVRNVPSGVTFFRRDELLAAARRGGDKAGMTEKTSLGLIRIVPRLDEDGELIAPEDGGWRPEILALGGKMIECEVGRIKADVASIGLLQPNAGDWYVERNGFERSTLKNRLLPVEAVLAHVARVYNTSVDALRGAIDLTDTLEVDL